MARKAVRQPMQDVADHCPGGRSHHADDLRQVGQTALLRFGKQAFCCQSCAGFLEQRQQRPLARQFEAIDHDLVLRAARVGGELAGGDHLQPVLGAEIEALGVALPHHPVDHRAFVFERAVEMPRSRALHSRQFAAQPHKAEAILDRALQQRGYFADREGLRIVALRHARYQPGIVKTAWVITGRRRCHEYPASGFGRP